MATAVVSSGAGAALDGDGQEVPFPVYRRDSRADDANWTTPLRHRAAPDSKTVSYL